MSTEPLSAEALLSLADGVIEAVNEHLKHPTDSGWWGELDGRTDVFAAELDRYRATLDAARAQGRAEALDVLRDIAENSYHAATRHDDGGISPTCGTCMARAAIKGKP
jgi:hypothetical protein